MSRKTALVIIVTGWPIPVWLAAVGLSAAGLLGPSIMLFAFVSTWCVGLAVGGLRVMYSRYRLERIKQQMPEHIQASANDDGTVTCTITRYNGDITTILAPGDYHPSQDGGRWIFEQLLDEKSLHEFELAGAFALYALVHGEEDE